MYAESVDKFVLPANSVFQRNCFGPRCLGPVGVRSKYTFRAAIMCFKNYEFGDYPPMTSSYFKDSETIESSRNYRTMGPQDHPAKISTSVNNITTVL